MARAVLILIASTAGTVAAVRLLGRRPRLAESVPGKALAFGSFFVLPGLILVGGTNHHYEQAKSTAFCLSCHIIEPYGTSLLIDDARFLPAAHYQNRRIPAERACYACHTSYAMFGDVEDKIRGIAHVWHNALGTASDPVQIYQPFPNRSCLQCRHGARSYEEEAAHARIRAALLEGSKSCIMCHNLVHEVEKLDRFPRWDPEARP